MAGEVEPAKKFLLPYLQRADELQKHEPLVAYYCRLYAMERGLSLSPKERTKTTNAILVSLVSQLEKDKKSLQLSSEDSFYIEGFALNVFAKADKQDRSGRADLNTAKTFYVASIFIEILHQFGELQPDIEQKQKYAVWKAADIRKALSEGRKPVPGPPGGEEVQVKTSGGALDPELSPMKGAVKPPKQRAAVERASSAGFTMPGRSRDEQENSTSDSKPAYKPRESNNVNHLSALQQPPNPSLSGYMPPYPGSYYPSSSTPDSSVSSPSMNRVEYGRRAQSDEFNSLSYYASYNQHAPALPDVSGNSKMPTFSGHHGGSDAAYYQSLVGHVPSATVFAAKSFSSSDYGSSPLDDTRGVRLNESSGLERASSAPTTVKGQTYQPGPEKIVEAHKAARFSVSALAFDDVPTAISYLKQSLELLTNPSA